MSPRVPLTLSLLLLFPAASACAAGALRVELGGAEVRREELADGRRVLAWIWGVLVADPGLEVAETDAGLNVPLRGEVTVHGPRDADGRAPLTLLADGLGLTVNGRAAVATRDGDTVVGPPAAPMDPRAAVAIFLAMLILTALMIRQTRRSLANR